MITKSAKVWLGGAGGITLPITISQYDTGWEFAFSVYNGSVLYDPGVAVAVTLEGDKPDGTAFSIPGTFSDGVATFDGTSSVSAAAGTVACELRVSVSGETVGTANFDIIVEEAPLAQHVTSEDNFSAMQALLDDVSQDAAAAAQSATDAASAAGTAAQTVLDQAPTMVSNWLAEHVDPDTGYVIDNSLTVAGAAADAGATGEIKNAVTLTITMEQGSISNPANATRIRSVSYIYGAGKVTLAPSGYRVLYVYYFEPATHLLVDTVLVNAESATLNRPDCVARIVVSKGSGGTESLTPADVTVTYRSDASPESMRVLLELAASNGKSGVIGLVQGGIDANGDDTTSSTRVRSSIKLPPKIHLETGEQYTHIVSVFPYDENGAVDLSSVINPYASSADIDLDACYVRVVLGRRTSSSGSYDQPISPENAALYATANPDWYQDHSTVLSNDITFKSQIEDIYSTLHTLPADIPTEKFDPEYDLRTYTSSDISVDFSDTAYTGDGDVRNDTQPESIFLAQIYALFDRLAEQYPGYVTKSDPAVTFGYEYPAYANGVSGSSTYLDTSPYKTYMYTLRNPLPNIGTEGRNPLQRVLLVGGTHGNEYAAPFNLYLFAKSLCEDYLTDQNLFRLRSSFAFYIVPVLNGYGALHRHRGNANNIDINRNYPCDGWTIRNTDTMYSAGRCGYSGAEAGSEFETKLGMRLCTYIRPSIALDCHNYGVGEMRQFYTSFPRAGQLRFAYQAITEVSYALKKTYPQYFGTGFGVLQNVAANAPYTTLDAGGGQTALNWSEKKVPICATLEVSACINYNNGIADGTQNIDTYGPDAFAVAEYTLRNQIVRCCQWVLDHAPQMDYYWLKDVLLP